MCKWAAKLKTEGQVGESDICYCLLIRAAVWGALLRESKRHTCMSCPQSPYFPAPQISPEDVIAHLRSVSGRVC